MFFRRSIFQIYNYFQDNLAYVLLVLRYLPATMVHTSYYLFLTEQIGLSNTQALTLEIPTMVISIALEVPSGLWADRYGYRNTSMAGLGLFLLTSIAFWLVGLGVVPFSYLVLFVASGVFGAGMALLSGAFDALLVGLEADNLQKLFANRQTILGVTAVVAPLFGYFIATNFSLGTIYFVEGLFYLALLLLLWLSLDNGQFKSLESSEVSADDGWGQLWGDFRKVLELVWNNSFLRLQIFASLMWGFTVLPLENMSSQVLAISGDIAWNGFVYACAGGMAVVAGVVMKRVSSQKWRAFSYWFNFFLYGALLFVASFFIGNWIVLVLFVGAYLAGNLHEVVFQEFINSEITTNRAGILSFFALLANGTIFLSVFAGGWIADNLGYGWSWGIASTLIMFTTIPIYLQAHEHVK